MKTNVVIIGAGPAGLAAAYRLGRCPNVNVTVLEKESEPGGRVQTLALPDGYYADNSAQFFASNYRCCMRLMRELGIRDQLVEMNNKTFSALYLDERLQPAPSTVSGFLTTKTFSAKQKWALFRLSLGSAMRYKRGAIYRPNLLMKYDDMGLPEFISGKYGQDILDQVVEPLVAMAATTCNKLSPVYALSMAPITIKRHFVFAKGNGTFTKTLARACSNVRYASLARRIVIENDVVRGVETDAEVLYADHVVCAVPAYPAADLLGDLGKEKTRFLREVPYSTCLQLLFGMERPGLPYWGAGIPKRAGSFLSSVTEESFKSSHRVPEGKGLSQVFVVGDIAKELLHLDDGVLADKVFSEIRRLLPDYPKQYRFARVIRRERAMSVSTPGYQKALAGFNEDVANVRGLHLISDFQTNPLIEASVHLGEQTAKRITRQSAS